MREVDYCSGALLIIKKELFLKFGKFDAVYGPGYYEETDFCFTLQKNGYKVIYQPLAEIIHHETATMKSIKQNLLTENFKIFKEKWKEELCNQLNSGDDLNGRFSFLARSRKKILYVDDRAPDPKLGTGYPRTHAILNQLLKLNFNITFYSAGNVINEVEIVKFFQQKGIEMAEGSGKKEEFDYFLSQRKNYYDIILISRPHNMEKTADIVKKYSPMSFLIYDAEAIFALRNLAYREISGEKLDEKEKEKEINKEVELCRDADRVITVSED